MKARLVPLYLGQADDPGFTEQTRQLSTLLAEVAEILPPLPLGAPLPPADGALFPQLIREAYGRVPDFRPLTMPAVMLTSEFGTMAMWDWEIISYLRSSGVDVIAPYSLAGADVTCRALAAKRQLSAGKFLVYQDHGAGRPAGQHLPALLHAVMEGLPSHHSLLTTGHNLPGLSLVGQVFDLPVQQPGA
jgi:hypothetical protein